MVGSDQTPKPVASVVNSASEKTLNCKPEANSPLLEALILHLMLTSEAFVATTFKTTESPGVTLFNVKTASAKA